MVVRFGYPTAFLAAAAVGAAAAVLFAFAMPATAAEEEAGEVAHAAGMG
jgi:hypothetical protein